MYKESNSYFWRIELYRGALKGEWTIRALPRNRKNVENDAIPEFGQNDNVRGRSDRKLEKKSIFH